jgi:hypothetical protein
MSKCFVDFNARPFCPTDYVIGHRSSQMPRLVYLSMNLVELKQKLFLLNISEVDVLTHGVVIINDRRINSRRLCGSQLIDFFLENQTEIPIEWHGKKILFLGTVFYKEPTAEYIHKYISCLYEDNGVWTREMVTINRSFEPKVYVVAALKN